MLEGEADAFERCPVFVSRHLVLSRLCRRLGRWGERGFSRLPLKSCAEGADPVTVLPGCSEGFGERGF